MKTTCKHGDGGVYIWTCLSCRIRHMLVVPPWHLDAEVAGIVKQFEVTHPQLRKILHDRAQRKPQP